MEPSATSSSDIDGRISSLLSALSAKSKEIQDHVAETTRRAGVLRSLHEQLAPEVEGLRTLLASKQSALQKLAERKQSLNRKEAEVSAASARLQAERELLEKQHQFVAACLQDVAGNGGDVVKLNVGGTPFTTTLSTLTSDPDSMLG